MQLFPLLLALPALLAPTVSARAETALSDPPVALAPSAVSCGGDFRAFLDGIAAEAKEQGQPASATDSWLTGAWPDPAVLKADRRQGIFRKPFLEFAQDLIGDTRLPKAQAAGEAHAATLARVEAQYGVPRELMLAIWGFETDFGSFQGDYNTRDALLTLAHDCRRPEMFRPQVMAAIELHARGDLPVSTTGAWAGEIGMVQMLPEDILARGVDGDSDGHVRLKTSAEDALMSGGNMLKHHGWQAGQPWLVEVVLPETFDWSLSGLENDMPVTQWAALGVAPRRGTTLPDSLTAALLLPQGRKGPAFLAFQNFRVLLEWNQSLTYVTTAAYFATLVGGAEPVLAGAPEPLLTLEEMQSLQRKLQALGHEVGRIDGVLGAGTRRAVREEQLRLGLPADSWPGRDLLELL
ncbi:lytic murein transglycosylase [Pseudogemmobacter faecipullorum]|uniref:Lytic murein transglycosylase n=1 Tax=Pseudogemmobacter faecipullorum TaxID=2755041 RepID=A0ABS8CHI1_9RHOB|nr:lytic murein transglycosylase [Pseudogemmobacter faecipullorum]MCB5408643.1 lytic murein transglycosylase [Pseudogemmobacter faecipullorum]